MSRIQQKHFASAFLVSVSFLLTTCRKDISVPNSDCKKLFGTWDWVESSGGLWGMTINPGTEGFHQTVEYKSNGICKREKDGKKVSKLTFRFELGRSSYSADQVYLIKYEETGRKKRSVITDSFKFGHQDTLFLFNECDDCFVEIYVRKK